MILLMLRQRSKLKFEEQYLYWKERRTRTSVRSKRANGESTPILDFELISQVEGNTTRCEQHNGEKMQCSRPSSTRASTPNEAPP